MKHNGRKTIISIIACFMAVTNLTSVGYATNMNKNNFDTIESMTLNTDNEMKSERNKTSERNRIMAVGDDGTEYELIEQTEEEIAKISRGTSLPLLNNTNYHDLSNNEYYANLQSVIGNYWLYTNKYFTPNSDGEIHFEYYIRKKAYDQEGNMRIGIFDLTTGGSYIDFVVTDINSITNYKHGSMYFYNLDPTHYYAMGYLSICADWLSDPIPLTGYGYIRH